MKFLDWNDAKNEQLRRERGVCFEDVVLSLAQGGLLDIIAHPDPTAYPGQRIFIVRINDYVHLVPFVEDGNVVFLKTIIPSRKMTARYLRGKRT